MLKFRVKEIVLMDDTKVYTPQISKTEDMEEDWSDIDVVMPDNQWPGFQDEDEKEKEEIEEKIQYTECTEGMGDLKFPTYEEAEKVIFDYIKEEEEALKECVKEVKYHEVKLG